MKRIRTVADLKKVLHKNGIKTYKNKRTKASCVKRTDMKKINRMLAYDDDFEIPISGKATYSITYEVWDEESLEIGDTDEKGFESKDTKIEDFDDIEALVNEMLELNNGEWSQSLFYPEDLAKGHIWYGGQKDKDIRTGDETIWHYHFKNLSDDEAQYIFDHVK